MTTRLTGAGIDTSFLNGKYPQEGKINTWINFDGTGVIATRDSLNVGSIVDIGAGTTTINFVNIMGAADYSAVGSTNGWNCYVTTQMAISIKLVSGNSSHAQADVGWNRLQAIGALA